MIRFRCHRCKRPIAAPDGHVGKKVKCPGCMIVTIVPDIPGAQAAKALKRPESRPAPQDQGQTVDALKGAALALHPVQTGSGDDVVKRSAFDPASGTLTVPARTVAVFVQTA